MANDIVWDTPTTSGGDGIVWDKQPSQMQSAIKERLTNNTKTAGLGIAGLAGVGGAALGISNIADWVNAPKRLMNPIEEQLKNIQSNYPSLVGTSTDDLSGLIQGKAGLYSQRLKSIDTNVKVATNKLKSRLDDFNKTVLSKNLDDLAITAKTGAPKLFNSAYESYGAGLDAIDGFMKDSGATFTNKDIAKMVGDIKDKAIRNGVPETRLSMLTKLEEGLTPDKIDITKPIKFGNAKSIVDNITRNSDDETKFITKELWGDLVEKNAPVEVKEQLTKMNRDYKKFANARYELNRIAKMKSGEYNTEGLKKFFTKYADDMAQTDKQNLIKLLTEGEGIVQPIQGLKGKVSELSKNVSKKISVEDALGKIGTTSLKKKQSIMQALESFNQWSTKAQELVSQKAAIIKKYPIRSAITGGKIAVGVGKRLLGAGLRGIALDPSIMMRASIGQDPVEAIDRMISSKKATPEEIKNFLQSQVI